MYAALLLHVWTKGQPPFGEMATKCSHVTWGHSCQRNTKPKIFLSSEVLRSPSSDQQGQDRWGLCQTPWGHYTCKPDLLLFKTGISIWADLSHLKWTLPAWIHKHLRSECCRYFLADSGISANRALCRTSQVLSVLVTGHQSTGAERNVAQLKVTADGTWGYRLNPKKMPPPKRILPSSFSRCVEHLLSYLLNKTTVIPIPFFFNMEIWMITRKTIGMEPSWISLRQLSEYAMWRRRRESYTLRDCLLSHLG